MRRRWIFMAPLAIAGMVIFTVVGGQLVLQLWNWLLPPLFDVPRITFWQALGILLLCRILFGRLGAGSCGSGRSHFRNRMADRMADRVGDRWDAMTPEERERFRQRLRDRCGFDPAKPAAP